MKIGIITYWGAQTNYGQVLQCYALQKFLRMKGHVVFVIRYDREKDILPNSFFQKISKFLNPLIIVSYFFKQLEQKKINKDISLHNRSFDDFRKKYINQSAKSYKSFFELKENPPKADLYITGSDQVWNYWNIPLKRYKNVLHSFFLDFGDAKIKRIAYAASWGITHLPMDYTKAINPLIKNFDYISVREKSGIALCNQCGRENAEWVCDPTLLLCENEYRNLYKENNVELPKKKYLFLYLLSAVSNSTLKSIYRFAERKKCSVIYVSGNNLTDHQEKIYATIPQWLNLIDNAEYVITNSYHGAVFSIIFNTRFCVLPFKRNEKERNERFDSLFQLAEIKERYLYKKDFSILEEDFSPKQIDPPFFMTNL